MKGIPDRISTGSKEQRCVTEASLGGSVLLKPETAGTMLESEASLLRS